MSKKHTSGSVLSLALTLALVSTVIPFSVQATDKYWSYSSCGVSNWWDYNCWSSTFGGVLDGNGQPLAGDDVYLYNAGIDNIQISYWNTVYPDATLNSLTINATGSGSMTLYQSGYNLQTLSETVGDTGTAAVVQNGGIHSVTNNFILGNTATGNGSFSINLTGTLSAGDITVGNDGTGTLNITNGGSVTSTIGSYIGMNANSTGTVTVNGAGSSLTADRFWTGINWDSDGLTVGYDGNGILNIENGGSVTSEVVSNIGWNVNSTGTVTVTGTDSTWNASNLTVGKDGTGTLNIENGGSVTSESTSHIGWDANSNGTAIVTGTGSSWTANGALSIGSSGTGILNIENGGWVNSEIGNVGSGGQVTVSGTGSGWTVSGTGASSALVISVGGILNIESGGLVTSLGSTLGFSDTGSGTVTVTGNGSAWTNTDALIIGHDGTGILSILSGGSVSNETGYIGGGLKEVSCGILCTEWDLFYGEGEVTVDGVNSSWVNNSRLYIYNGTLSILNGGSVSSGGAIVGDSTVIGSVIINGIGSSWNSSAITIGNGSSLDITNNGLVTSGLITGDNFNGGSISISSGGSVTSSAVSMDHVTVDGIGSNLTSSSHIFGNELHITGGGSVTASSNISLETLLTVDGIGSSVSSDTFGGGITNGNLIVTNGGSVTASSDIKFDTLTVDGIGSSISSDALLSVSGFTNGNLTVTNGGSVISFDVSVAGNANMSGTSLPNEGVNLDIAGSLSVGGLLDIGEYANVTVADTTTLNSIHMSGGNLVTGQLNGSLADALFDAGSLIVINAGPAVDIGGATLGNAGGGSFSMVLPQDTLINDGAALTLHNNSSLGTATLFNEGVVSGYGSVNGLVNGGVNSVFAASGGSLTLGNANSFNGFRTLGLIDVGADAVTLNSQQFAQLGYLTTLNGGTLNAQNGVFLSGGNAIVGSGNVNASIAAQTGSTVFASGNLALGDIDKFDGFYSQGNLVTNEHIVTINDRNEAVLGSLTTLGNTGGAGTLQSSNGLLLQQGNNLIGYGTVNGDFINQGHVEETSVQPADFIEFTGNVSGAGDYAGSIIFSGTFMPGNSPALVSFEDIAFGLDSVLTMEIGGLFAGSQYDVLEGLPGSSATLAGTLDIDLYNLGGGLFAPSLGDSFDILTAEVLTGKFDLLTLTVLGGGLDWQLDYLFDEIGTIDIVRLSVVSASTVPVPQAVWLFASGLLGLVAVARRKKLA